MKNNTMSGLEFINDYVFWAILAFIWYQNLIFINISGLTIFKSNLVLIGGMLVFFVANYLMTFEWSRNPSSIAEVILIPFGVYTFFTYNDYLSHFFIPVLCVAGMATIMYLCYIIFRRINFRSKSKIKIIKTRRSYAAVRNICALTSIVMIVYIIGKSFIGGALVSPTERATSKYGDQYTVANNIDTIVLLDEDKWADLTSSQERLNVLQCVVNIEGNYLGLNREIHIYGKKMDDDTLGYYSDRESAIYINIDHLMDSSGYSVLESVCHEMYHAAEYRYVEIYNKLNDEDKASYFFNDASVYAREFDDYEKGSDDYIAYYGQKCERDARTYSKKAVADYNNKISHYLGTNDYINLHTTDI